MNNYYAGPEYNVEENMEGNMNGNMQHNNQHMNEQCCCMPHQNCCTPCCSQNFCCPPIYECPQEKVCHKYFTYEVPHITPCNTKVINHHTYKHTYTPEFSCCEEDVVSNVYENRCC